MPARERGQPACRSRNRARYAPGAIPAARRNCALKRCTLAKPDCSATTSSFTCVVPSSNRARAILTRWISSRIPRPSARKNLHCRPDLDPCPTFGVHPSLPN